MPYVAVVSHKLLSGVAAVRMAIDLLIDPTITDELRAEVHERARTQLAEMEQALKELIVAPRDVLVDEAPSG